jgi:molecular chaperone GrpE
MEKEKDLSQADRTPNSTNGQAEPLEEKAPIQEDSAEPAAETETATTESAPATEDDAAARAAETQPSLAELQERFLRLAADFANYKRRNEAERAEIADWARRDFALALLPILDDFGLMMEYETQHPERLAEGAKLIRQKMLELLIKQGLEKIEALNQPYHYELHEAVLSQPVKEPALDHTVLSVMQEGYLFKGRVLRPSKVIVGQYVGPETAPSPVSDPDQNSERQTEPNSEKDV